MVKKKRDIKTGNNLLLPFKNNYTMYVTMEITGNYLLPV